MDYEAINQGLRDSGVDEPVIEAIVPALQKITETTGQAPYITAVELILVASNIVRKCCPNEDLMRLVNFMNKIADNNMRGSLTKDVINTNGSNQNYTPRD